MKCDTCSKKKYGYLCDGCIHDPNTEDADKYEDKYEYMTNADRIRAMTDEELAEVLGKLVHCGGCPMRDNCKVDNLPCNNVLIDWLQQPAGGADQ